jgi:hypothetical protein
MTHWSMHICEDLISSKKFGTAIAREAHPGDRVVVFGDYESANSLNFYQPFKVEVVEGRAYALIPGMKFPDSPKILLSTEEFQKAWHSAGRIFALVPEARMIALDLKGTVVFRALDRILICNQQL